MSERPLDTFIDCHAGIVSTLLALRELPDLARAADRAREVATAALGLFGGPVLEHHQEEERDLFPAVLASARAGNELAEVEAMVQRLVQEHRVIERQWRGLEDAVRDAGRGRPARLDAAALEELVSGYLVHANFEEQWFLPLAERILGRDGNHMAALGMALHLRHAKVPAGYV
jgi:hypothetical protein